MNTATLLNELHSHDVVLFVVGPDRLRFEARKDVLSDALISALREHKRDILRVLGKDGTMATLLRRQCPFCREKGMRIEETWKDELHYFDTCCVNCGKLVEVLVV